MPLTLVLGPANSAKAGEVLGAYADAAHRGALLVVPTAPDADHYARELAAGGAVLGSVRTFAGLAREVAARAGFGARCLSARQRERVLRRVVRGTRFEVLGSSAQAAGFVSAAGELIAELQRSLVAPQRFAQALGAWAEQDARRAAYASDLSSLYVAYRRELDRLGMVDAELYAWRALDALRAAPGRWGADPVFFYGFDDLTALERDSIETLARIVGARVTVSLTYEPDHAALLARAEGVQALAPLADRVLELEALDEHYAPAARDGAAPSRAAAVRGARTSWPSASIQGRRCGFWRPAASAPRPSSSRARCSRCFRLGYRARRSWSCTGRRRGSRRCSPTCSASTGSSWQGHSGCRSRTRRSAAPCARSRAARCWTATRHPRRTSSTTSARRAC